MDHPGSPWIHDDAQPRRRWEEAPRIAPLRGRSCLAETVETVRRSVLELLGVRLGAAHLQQQGYGYGNSWWSLIMMVNSLIQVNIVMVTNGELIMMGTNGELMVNHQVNSD